MCREITTIEGLTTVKLRLKVKDCLCDECRPIRHACLWQDLRSTLGEEGFAKVVSQAYQGVWSDDSQERHAQGYPLDAWKWNWPSIKGDKLIHALGDYLEKSGAVFDEERQAHVLPSVLTVIAAEVDRLEARLMGLKEKQQCVLLLFQQP